MTHTEQLNNRLRVALTRCKTLWWIVMLGATWYTAAQLPTWCMILLVPFAVVSYMFMLFITINILANTIPPEELLAAEAENAQNKADRSKLDVLAKIAERKAAGEEVSPDEIMEAMAAAGVIDIARVTDMGPVVGTYRDSQIFEYILVKIPGKDVEDKLMYHGPANIVDGNPEIPVIDGMIFACVENILYAKETA